MVERFCGLRIFVVGDFGILKGFMWGGEVNGFGFVV